MKKKLTSKTNMKNYDKSLRHSVIGNTVATNVRLTQVNNINITKEAIQEWKESNFDITFNPNRINQTNVIEINKFSNDDDSFSDGSGFGSLKMPSIHRNIQQLPQLPKGMYRQQRSI